MNHFHKGEHFHIHLPPYSAYRFVFITGCVTSPLKCYVTLNPWNAYNSNEYYALLLLKKELTIQVF